MPCRPEAVHFLALTGRPRLLPWMNSSTGGGGRRGKKQRTGANKGWGRRGGGGGGGDGRSDSRSGACSAGGGVARHGVRAGDERRGKSGCIGGVCHTATLALATLVPVGHLCPCSRAPHGCRQRGPPFARPPCLLPSDLSLLPLLPAPPTTLHALPRPTQSRRHPHPPVRPSTPPPPAEPCLGTRFNLAEDASSVVVHLLSFPSRRSLFFQHREISPRLLLLSPLPPLD